MQQLTHFRKIYSAFFPYILSQRQNYKIDFLRKKNSPLLVCRLYPRMPLHQLPYCNALHAMSCITRHGTVLRFNLGKWFFLIHWNLQMHHKVDVDSRCRDRLPFSLPLTACFFTTRRCVMSRLLFKVATRRKAAWFMTFFPVTFFQLIPPSMSYRHCAVIWGVTAQWRC